MVELLDGARILIAPSVELASLIGGVYRFDDTVVCEVNREPPNPASDAFHAALGFSEVGLAAIHGGSKTVRYLARAL